MSPVVCIGEPLVLVASDGEHVGGAEANVASGLAAAGIPAAWAGRVGTDPYGELVRRELAVRGVDLTLVDIDSALPTGWYSKCTRESADGERITESNYRRAGSAASAMDVAFLERVAGAALVHCSGITAALSPTCSAMMRALVCDRAYVGDATVSFDVNWREQLWPGRDTTAVVELARAADLVLVGGDEAERVFGTADPRELRAILPRPQTIVVKDGARQAITIALDGSAEAVPALSVEVVEPVGAGDAFAAGFLTGVARGEDARTCLRRGHIGAATTLTVRADVALPPSDVVDALLACDDAVWQATRVTRHGFDIGGGGVT